VSMKNRELVIQSARAVAPFVVPSKYTILSAVGRAMNGVVQPQVVERIVT
jgi:hypothetical protein